MPKYFVDEALRLNEDTIFHLTKVLRVKVKDKIILCDGKAVDYHCVVESTKPLSLKVEKEEESKTEPKCKITLYQAMPKSDKMEWIIQKAVELGVHRIVPVYTEHSVKKAAKADRYQKIAASAAGQSMRGIIPHVHLPVLWEEAIKTAKEDFMIAAHEKAAQPLTSNLPLEIGLWIGPEGGFSKKEAEIMESKKFNLISLGPRILRTETAAISAIAQIMMVTG